MTGLAVRPAVVAGGDAHALARLRWLWRAGEGETGGMAWAEFRTAFASWVRFRQDSHYPFLAEADGAPVGMAWLVVIERVPGPLTWLRLGGHLQSLFVLPEHRTRGVGSSLVSAVLAEARSQGLDWVLVHPRGESCGIYERAGFTAREGALEARL